MTWRDSSGRALADYPHPSVAVDVALLSVVDERLVVLLHRREEARWALPGTFVRIDETLEQAALRVLREKVAVIGERPEQLRVFDALHRDDRGRVMSVAHVDLVPPSRLVGADGRLEPVDALPGPLAFDHDAIVEASVSWARAEYRDRPDPRRLVSDEFTLLELQRVHEAVLGRRLQKDTFRRQMIDQLDGTGTLSRGTVGKPARLYRRAAT